MIQVKELRIGNVVFVETEHLNENYDDCNFVFVEEIFYDGINRTMGDSSMYLEVQLHPIALTSEVLKTAGFDLNGNITIAIDFTSWRLQISEQEEKVQAI